MYLVFRVFLVSMTVDEYTSINVHATMSWWDILNTGQPNIVWAPNNHVLNTLFIKLEMILFGKKDWAVRLHILGAFLVCYYYGVKIMQRITVSEVRQFLFLAILFLNPYLLDFFGIARGYAMSVAGFVAAFFYMMKYAEDHALKNLRLVFLWLLLAIWSNFSALYMLPLAIVLLGYEICKQRNTISVRTHILNSGMACAVIGVIIILPLLKTIHSGETYGGHTGLYQDMIVNYIYHYIHHNPHISRHDLFMPGWKNIEVAGLVLLFAWMGINALSFLIKSSGSLVKTHLFTLFFVIGVVIISKILFVFGNVPYPSSRTTLVYSMPFYLAFCISMERICLKYNRTNIILWASVIFLIWHFFSALSFHNTIEWWRTGDAKDVVRFMKEELKVHPPGRVVKIGIESWQYPSLAFYTETIFKDEMTTYWTDMKTMEPYDYLFVSNEFVDKVPKEYVVVEKFRLATLFKWNVLQE